MKLEDAVSISHLTIRVSNYDDVLKRMGEQDWSQSTSVGYYHMYSEIWPQPSAETAKQIRELLRQDFIAQRAERIEQLNALGVEVDDTA